MSEESYPGIQNLIKISELDAKIARISNEKIKLEAQLQEKQDVARELEVEVARKLDIASKKRKSYTEEESFLKTEQQRLVERRKTLHSIGDYKSQMAAEREINASSKQLSEREDKLLSLLEAAEKLEKEAKEVKSGYDTLKAEVDELVANSDETLKNLEERYGQASKEREGLASKVLEVDLNVYERIAERYPANSVVPLQVENKSCGGCQLALGPQIIVELMRGNSLVTCRGCGRILYMPENTEE